MGLPKNWVEANISDLIGPNDLFRDGDWVESKDQDPKGEVRLIQLADIGTLEFKDKSSRFLTLKKAEELRCSLIIEGDILVARMPDPIGRACIFPLTGNFATVVDVAIIRVNESINNKYLCYLINSPDIYSDIVSRSSGSTRKRISRKNLDKIKFPIPPLPEQERIVAKLDALFGQIDLMKQSLERIPQLLANFKQQVLTQAVTGKLTEVWREGKDLKIDIQKISEFSGKTIELKYNGIGWLKTDVNSISSRVSVGHVGKTSKYYTDESGVPFLRSQNVKPGKIILDKIAYITKDFHKKLGKSQLFGGELLIVRVGANRGDSTILPYGLGEINCANIVFARVKQEFSNYLNIFFQSNNWLNIIEELSTGTAQGVINTKIVAKVNVDLPSIEEQQEIVNRVESLFAKADAIKAQYQNLKTKIDRLPQAILHKAFKGELVPQLPTDGNAKDLLKEIEKLKGEAKGNQVKRKKTHITNLAII